MKKVCLKTGLSYAIKGFSCVRGIAVDVEDDIAEKLMRTGRFEITDMLPVSQTAAPASESADIPSMKKDELIAFAEAHDIDLEGCKNNNERIERIQSEISVKEFVQIPAEEEEAPHEEAVDFP